MTFEQKINEDLKDAMKAGDKIRLETLRALRASIIEFSKSGTGKEMSDEDAQKILLNASKKRKDAMPNRISHSFIEVSVAFVSFGAQVQRKKQSICE